MMTENEITERMKGYDFYHTIRLTENVRTNGWEVIRPTTDLTLGLLRTLDLRGKRVLDIGCRDGLFSFEAERQGAAEVVAFDNDPSIPMREFLIPCLGSKVHMHELNLFDLRPETFGTFDVVIFAGVLYHLRYPFWALKLIRDVLTEGGTLVLETAVLADDNRLPLLFCPVGAESPYEPSSCTFYNVKALKDTLHSLGLAVQRVDTLHNSYPPPPGAPPIPSCPEQAPVDRAALIAVHKPEILDTTTVAYWDRTHRLHSLNQPLGQKQFDAATAGAAAAVEPLRAVTERLRRYESGLPQEGAAMLGDQAHEAADAVWQGRRAALDYAALEGEWPAGKPLAQVLAERNVGLLYLNERILRHLELARPKEAWDFLNGPWPPGWQCVNGGNEPGRRWRLYLRNAH